MVCPLTFDWSTGPSGFNRMLIVAESDFCVVVAAKGHAAVVDGDGMLGDEHVGLNPKSLLHMHIVFM